MKRKFRPVPAPPLPFSFGSLDFLEIPPALFSFIPRLFPLVALLFVAFSLHLVYRHLSPPHSIVCHSKIALSLFFFFSFFFCFP